MRVLLLLFLFIFSWSLINFENRLNFINKFYVKINRGAESIVVDLEGSTKRWKDVFCGSYRVGFMDGGQIQRHGSIKNTQ